MRLLWLLLMGSTVGLCSLEFLQSRLERGLIFVNRTEWKTHVTQAPRSYPVVAMLTSMSSEMPCKVCVQMLPVFEKFASSVAAYPDKVPFGVVALDYRVGKSTMQKLKLKRLPTMVVFPPSERGLRFRESKDEFTVAFARDQTAERIAHEVATRTGTAAIPITKSPLETVEELIDAALDNIVWRIIGLAAIVGFLLRFVLPSPRKWKFWYMVCMLTISVALSGFIYTRIHGPPFVGVTREGAPQLLHPGGMRSQYQLEGLITLTLLMVGSHAVIFLTHKAPYANQGQNAKVLTSLGTLCAALYYYWKIFCIKVPWHPHCSARFF